MMPALVVCFAAMGTGDPLSPPGLYCFGPYQADTHRGELRKFGIRVRLEPKPWQLLLALLERPGEVVTRTQLQRLLWADNVFVDFENGLNVAVKKLRGALNDSAEEPAYIERVAGAGYRFVARVEKLRIQSQAALTIPPAEAASVATTPGAPVPSAVSSRMVPAFVSNHHLSRWAAILVALIAVTASLAWRPRPKAVSTASRTTVLVGAFENATGEAVLDGTLKFALERELANSQFSRVVSPERIQDILKLMRRPPDSPLDRSLALDICRRTPDIGILVTGRVERIGSGYLLAAEIVDPGSGNILRAADEQALTKDDILPALRRLSHRVRSAIGESTPTPPVVIPQPEAVTTSSLRALQLYSEADDLMIRHGPGGENIVALLGQALAEDPDFASAHILLGHVLSNMGRHEADEHFERAFALADTANERERLFILGSYYYRKSAQPGDMAWTKAKAAYEQLIRHYPDDYWGLNNLAVVYDYEALAREGLQLRVRQVELRPENEKISLGELWLDLMSFGEVAAANRLAARCDAQPAFAPCRGLFLQRDALPIWRELRRGHPEEARRLVKQLPRPKLQGLEPRYEEEWNRLLSHLYTGAGMLHADAALSATSPTDDWQVGEPVLIAEYREDGRALSAALSRQLKRQASDANGSGTVLRLIKAGRLREARTMLAEMQKTYPPDAVRVARGYVRLAEGDPLASISDLRAGAIGYGKRHSIAFITVCDRLAAALDNVGQTDDAAQTLSDCEDQIAHWSDRDFVHPRNLVARRHLATLYRRTGRVTEAEAIEDALRRQLALADADHPIARALRQ